LNSKKKHEENECINIYKTCPYCKIEVKGILVFAKHCTTCPEKINKCPFYNECKYSAKAI